MQNVQICPRLKFQNVEIFKKFTIFFGLNRKRFDNFEVKIMQNLTEKFFVFADILSWNQGSKNDVFLDLIFCLKIAIRSHPLRDFEGQIFNEIFRNLTLHTEGEWAFENF